MLFSSSIFIFGFLPLIMLFYYLIPNKYRKLRNLFLFIMSLFFYAWGEPTFVLIMLLSILINYIFALIIDVYFESKLICKIIIFLMLIVNLIILFTFKYTGFFIENINNLLGTKLNTPNIALPIGISFFTFQAISYVIDVYRRYDNEGDIIRAQKNPINVGLYISLFPQLIAGPIVRYKTIAQQINTRIENFNDFNEGVRRFIIGLSKKVLISNNLALVADHAFSQSANSISVSFAWLGAISYSLQIFYDFSGYSDMAIGLGKMFGFHFLENFNYPYISTSISEFWRRWHISLGSWFRDYVYFPLGGSRKGFLFTMRNLFVVWFLTGFWHGANWTYIMWGLYFFVFILVEKFYSKKGLLFKTKLFNHIYTLIIILFGWVLFRSNSLTYAISYITTMFGLNGTKFIDDMFILYFRENFIILILGILFSIPIYDILKSSRLFLMAQKKIPFIVIYEYIVALSYLLIFVVTLSYIIKGAYNPFIYFNF